MPARARRSRCPVACTLDVLGDKWSLLVVRDVIRGKRRYAEFLASPEGIPTNILADRLKRLVEQGVMTSKIYSQHPPRAEYELTAKGEDLRPIVRAMVDWPPTPACNSRYLKDFGAVTTKKVILLLR
jgi:DNA-binding HxlR family transcriptional regulator